MPASTNKNTLRDAPALEFPDWNGMQPHYSRMTFKEAIQWNDEVLALFPIKRKPSKLETERRCDVEFIL